MALHCVEPLIGGLTTPPGQGYKRVFGRWDAVCFLATYHFSLCAPSRTNTTNRYGIKRLGIAYETLFHTSNTTTHFQDQYVCPCHIPVCRHFRLTFVPDAKNYRLSLSTLLGVHWHSLALRFYITICHHTLFSASPEDLTIHGTTVSTSQHPWGRVIAYTVP
jgi:hypothetical protein